MPAYSFYMVMVDSSLACSDGLKVSLEIIDLITDIFIIYSRLYWSCVSTWLWFSFFLL